MSNSKSAACSVKDEFILSLKDAELHRTIIYNNTTISDFPVEIGLKKFNYPYHCEEFAVTIDSIPTDFSIWPNNYLQQITISSQKKILKPGESLEIKIICLWRDFYNFLSDLYYTFQYEELAKYKLVINNYSLDNALYILKINGRDALKDTDYYIQHNSTHFAEQTISPNEEFCLKLFSIATPKDLGILDMIIENDSGKLFRDCVVIIIQHLLSDAYHLIAAFSKGGAEKDSIFIIGIPYSTKYSTVKFLRSKGYKNIETPVKYPFEDELKSTLTKAINLAEDTGKKILIIEDGGYLVPLLHTPEFIDKASLFLGAVEQTANGIWRDRDIKEKKKIDFQIPIVNVAESKIKSDLESPLIGRAVSRNIELIYNKTFRGISGATVGIVGFGRTGSKVASDLKLNGALVSVYDNDNEKIENAKKQEFHVYDSIIEIIKNNKIIVETTGKTWESDKEPTVRMDLLLALQHDSFFVSGSSKRMGIDYDQLKIVVEPKFTLNIPGMGVQYKLRNNKHVTLIADGYPVNFFLGESVPDKDIAFILSLLYKSGELVVKNFGTLPKRIIDIDHDDKSWGFFDAQKKIGDYHSKKIN